MKATNFVDPKLDPVVNASGTTGARFELEEGLDIRDFDALDFTELEMSMSENPLLEKAIEELGYRKVLEDQLGPEAVEQYDRAMSDCKQSNKDLLKGIGIVIAILGIIYFGRKWIMGKWKQFRSKKKVGE